MADPAAGRATAPPGRPPLVATVVAMVADGLSVPEILDEHPDLEADDIAECLRYASLAVQERELLLRRQQSRRSHEIADLILANLDAVADDLSTGAVVVLNDDRVRESAVLAVTQGHRKIPEPKGEPLSGPESRGAPGRIRTCDARFGKPTLYPLSYGAGPVDLAARNRPEDRL